MGNGLKRVPRRAEAERNNKASFIAREGKHLAAKAGFVIVLVLFLVMVYGRDGASDVDLGELRQEIKTNCDMTNMHKCSKRELMKFMALNAEEYGDTYIYFKSTESLGVEELLILKTESDAKLDAAKDACETRIRSQISVFEGYGVEQIKLLNSAVLFTKGNYLFYSVGGVTPEYEEVFRNAVQ